MLFRTSITTGGLDDQGRPAHRPPLGRPLGTLVGACGNDSTTGSRPSAAGTTTTVPASASSTRVPSTPNLDSIVVLGHSGTTGYGSDPSNPGGDVRENSWATGSNPAVDSIYRRLLATHPAMKGHATSLGVDAYYARVQQVCARHRGCFTDDGALQGKRLRDGDLTGDGNHLSVQGLATLASIAWAALPDAIKYAPDGATAGRANPVARRGTVWS